MQTIDNGFWRTSSAAGHAGAAHGSRGFHGSLQQRADRLVRDTVLADLGESVGSSGGRGHGIEGVAAAIQKVLSGQDVTGTDAADDVLRKIETSLHKAAQKLADRGVDAKTIDATIDRFRDQLAKALDGVIGGGSGASGSGSTGGSTGSTSGSGSTGGTDAPTNTPAPAPTTTSVSSFVAREVRKERASLELTTAEGDRVSLRFRSKEVTTDSIAQSTSSDGTITTAAKTTLISRGSLEVEVEGDLNEDEIAAIHNLIDKAYVVATKFFSGDVQAAFSAADSLDVDSDQIAAYQLNMTYSRKISAAYGYAGTSLPPAAQPPATGDLSSAGGAGSASSNTSSSSGSTSTSGGSSASGNTSAGSTSSGASSTSASSADASDAASSPSNTAASDAAGSDTTDGTPTSSTDTPPAIPPTSARQTIVAFINDALSKLGSVKNVGSLSFSMHVKMSVLVTAIETVQPKQPTGEANQAVASNTKLLGASLEKIAAA